MTCILTPRSHPHNSKFGSYLQKHQKIRLQTEKGMLEYQLCPIPDEESTIRNKSEIKEHLAAFLVADGSLPATVAIYDI